jgi:hypothetical protein
MSIDLLAWLIVGHMVGDFLFQTRWMAENKGSQWDALLIHCFLYTIIIAVFALPAGGLTWWSLLFILLAHIVLDRRGFTRWWLKNINKADDMFWLMIVHDQTWHLLALVIAVVLQSLL